METEIVATFFEMPLPRWLDAKGTQSAVRKTVRLTAGQIGTVAGVLALAISATTFYIEVLHGGAPATHLRITDPVWSGSIMADPTSFFTSFAVTNQSRHDEVVKSAELLITGPNAAGFTVTEAVTVTRRAGQ